MSTGFQRGPSRFGGGGGGGGGGGRGGRPGGGGRPMRGGPPDRKGGPGGKRKSTKMKRPMKCRFCTKEGCPRPVYVDYKDLRTLKVMITRDGNMLARRRTGNCAKFQRAVREAVLRARFMGLLPYVIRED